MKQVVIVAPHFPPSNMTAVHRCRHFAAHLPKFGWSVKVLSVKPDYYEEKLDYELERLLPDNLEIIRTKAVPTRPLRIIGAIDIRAFWWHYRTLCNLAYKEKVDLIYISIPPNFSSLLGELIYRRFNIPYAIDYQDPWVHPWPGSEILLSKAWFSYNMGRLLEPIAVRHAGLITAVAPSYYEGVLKRHRWLDASRCVAMPVGVEKEDFIYLDKHPRLPYLFEPSDGNFHIVYAGAMLPKAYTTLEALFQALHLFRKRNSSLAQRIRFHFIGTGSKPQDPSSHTIKPYIKRYELLDIVSEHPARIPYLDALNHLRYANAVLILGSSEPHYTPSKLFQAILSKRHVMAILHAKSTAVDMLRGTRAGIVVAFDEQKPPFLHKEEIAEMLYYAVNNNYSPEKIDWDRFKDYSAEALTGQLASAFDSIIGRDNEKRR